MFTRGETSLSEVKREVKLVLARYNSLLLSSAV